MHINDPLKPVHFCETPKKYPQNLHTPTYIHFFLKKNPKSLKFKILNKRKMVQAYVCRKYQSIAPPPIHPHHHHLGTCTTQADLRTKERIVLNISAALVLSTRSDGSRQLVCPMILFTCTCLIIPNLFFRVYSRSQKLAKYILVNPITVGNFAFLFNCTPVGRTSDSMMVPT